MNNIENILISHRESQEGFSDGFTKSVMKEIHDMSSSNTMTISLWQNRLWKLAAACFVGCLLSVYASDGLISVDSILGLSEYSDIELTQSYKTYSVWDGEY
jgi:hypothetical protein